MAKPNVSIFALLVLASALATTAQGQPSDQPETVQVHNGPVTLHAWLWRPPGRGPFPAVLLNHGSGRTREELERLGPYEGQAGTLGPVFARHGYVFLYLFRRGVGLPEPRRSDGRTLLAGPVLERAARQDVPHG